MKKIITLLLLCFILSVPALAQDDREAENFILDAIEQIAEQDSYRFDAINTTTTTYIEQDDFENQVVMLTESTGYFADEDYFMQQTITGAQSLEQMTAVNGERFTVNLERTYIDDVLYVRAIDDGDDIFGGITDMPLEWTVFEPIEDIMSASVEQIALNNIFGTPPPPYTLPLRVGTIQEITELDGDTIDGMAVRVFEVELDAMAIMLESMGGLSGLAEAAEALLNPNSVLSLGEFSYSMRLWIGEEDGLLYRADGSSRSYLPYAEADDEAPSFNMETLTSFELNLSEYGEEVLIINPAAE